MNTQNVNIADYGYTILQIETVSSCNMNCKFCAYPMRKDKGLFLEEMYIHDVINSLKMDERIKYICLSHFNEPLLDRRIFNITRFVKQKGYPVMIITNALLFNREELINKLLESEPDFIKISLQNLDSNQFNSSRNIDYPFLDYKKGIFKFLSLAKDKKPHIYVDIAFNFLSKKVKTLVSILGLELGDPSITDIAIDLKPKVKAFLSELKDFDHSFNFDVDKIAKYIDKMKKGYNSQEGFRISKNEFLKFKKFIYGKRQEHFFFIKKSLGCNISMLSILASGDVMPCCLACNNHLPMGNIKKESLKSILERNRSAINDLKKGRNLTMACRRCLGAPTKRGVFFKRFKDFIVRKFYE